MDTEFCAVDNKPCCGKCREQSRLVEKYNVFNKKTKEMETKSRMCPALMSFSDLPLKDQRRFGAVQQNEDSQLEEE